MRRAIAGLTLALAACGCTSMGGLEPDASWGADEAGLRIRAKGPAEAARGDEVAIEVRFGVRETRLRPGGLKLDHRHPAYFARLILTPVGGGDPVLVRARDPSLGMREPPPPTGGRSTWVLANEIPDPATVVFPLSVVWDETPVGEYSAVVELEYGADSRGTWRGKVRCLPFETELTAAPTITKTFSAPTRLRLSGRDVFYGDEAVEQIVVHLRNGFTTGLRIRQSDGGGILQGGATVPEVPRMLGRLAADLPPGSEFRYWIELFETSEAETHLWAPGSGSYRVLWKREFSVRAP